MLSPLPSRFLAAAAPGRLDPKWAMLTVYLTAQPFAGSVRSRAVYRFVGTLLGACAAIALVPALVDQPALLSVPVTAWAGLCLWSRRSRADADLLRAVDVGLPADRRDPAVIFPTITGFQCSKICVAPAPVDFAIFVILIKIFYVVLGKLPL
ncbi:hypothetical protein DNX69_13925 [Rhodopseudomonas palustris]|uniref:Uncharacterized protein n=1 Tax=Rhodopseudomonas palustris TaxID=1076 RepID=A0A323UE72_RHOPL|nr:FUSC family protein [Rhodopseudomonas palustris]PZA10463.1 hypothetical protein DNX69_13925 [Rhodopseudomonas palustris]